MGPCLSPPPQASRNARSSPQLLKLSQPETHLFIYFNLEAFLNTSTPDAGTRGGVGWRETSP